MKARTRLCMSLKLGLVLGLGPAIIMLLAYWYLTAFHRLKDVSQIITALSMLMLPKADDRCRILPSGKYRCLANFLFIGASKSGTTSMANHLVRHPHIKFIRRRIHIDGVHEVHRFDRRSYNYALPLVEQADELASGPDLNATHYPVLHYTPHYLYAPMVPFEIKTFYPQPDTLKFLVMLREPVSRAISSYWFKNSKHIKGVDSGSAAHFAEEMYAQIRKRQEYEMCMADYRRNAIKKRLEKCFGSEVRRASLGSRHLDKGIYYDQLSRYFLLFPPHNFLIITLEEFESSPVRVFERVCEFLGLSTYGPQGFDSPDHLMQMLNQTYLITENEMKEPIPQKVLDDLTNFYRPYNAKLEQLLGQPLGYPT